jgi:uncharacterized protein (TIGR02646 family)
MKIERGPDPGLFPHHAHYKPHLRPVFRCRCAYCLMPDDRLGGEEAMTVDHFKPERRYPQLRLAWCNLYYSCSICNSHYKKDHPKPEEEAQGKRFVDPCEEDCDEHFRLVRDNQTGDFCRVSPLSPAAEYSVFRLKLNQRPFLRHFWRELDHEERQLLGRQQEIHDRIEDCARLAQRQPSNEEFQRIRADFESQLAATIADLEAIRQIRPFPVA